MKSKNEDEFNQFCKQIVSLDLSIRFAGIANEDGVLESIAERENLIPLLTPEERAQYAITAATRQYTRLRWEFMLGKIQYASSKYEKLIRATIPITDENSTLSYVLLLSFDPGVSNFHEIIIKKIIPFINDSKANLKRLHG
ncbi:hypothetical protein [Candidatus Nitrosocosmicus hydrocola]|uniref:hypothetical protein n=1 Tax=Candidatus Nitrosocosmicus hydrocola TaxID=1826872 RepID=UPI0011E5A8F8|nr:hypothetical protein [Candidatus Nitrosocosmicus hydrocola]